MVATFGRRDTDLPQDAPWWARWLEANIRAWAQWIKHGSAALIILLAETYAAYPQETTEFIKRIVPASWWPHIVAGAFLLRIYFRALVVKRSNKRKEIES